MSDQGATEPTYDEMRRARAETPANGKFLRAKDYPNGLDVKVVGIEVRPGYQGEGFEPYWKVSATGIDGEAYVKENAPMSKKLEDLEIPDPTGRQFILTQVTIMGNVTWQIARAL